MSQLDRDYWDHIAEHVRMDLYAEDVSWFEDDNGNINFQLYSYDISELPHDVRLIPTNSHLFTNSEIINFVVDTYRRENGVLGL